MLTFSNPHVDAESCRLADLAETGRERPIPGQKSAEQRQSKGNFALLHFGCLIFFSFCQPLLDDVGAEV